MDILERAMTEGYLPRTDSAQLTQLVHGSLASTADRSHGAESERAQKERTDATVLFIQRGLGAQFDQNFRPIQLPLTRPALSVVS